MPGLRPKGAKMARADDTDELALIAQEISAEVIRGPVRYGPLEDIERAHKLHSPVDNLL